MTRIWKSWIWRSTDNLGNNRTFFFIKGNIDNIFLFYFQKIVKNAFRRLNWELGKPSIRVETLMKFLWFFNFVGNRLDRPGENCNIKAPLGWKLQIRSIETIYWLSIVFNKVPILGWKLQIRSKIKAKSGNQKAKIKRNLT